MRKLIWLILILATLYGGYWFVGAHLLQGQLDKWVAAEKSAGRTADFAQLKVQGFPSRFDIAAEGIELYDPERRLGWSAPRATLAALAYQPQHYIAVLPQTQVIRAPGADINITSKDMRASLVFSPGPSFVLDRMNFVASGLGIDAGAPELRTGASLLRFATDRAEGRDFAHRLGFTASDLILPDFLLAQLRSLPTELPATLDRLHLDATVDFDKRWDRHALSGTKPQPTQITLSELSLGWGPLGLTLSGDVTLDAAGMATGQVDMMIRGVEQMLEIAVSLRLVPAERQRLLLGTMTMLAPPDANGVRKLSFQARDGQLHLGPLGLMRLPPLRLN